MSGIKTSDVISILKEEIQNFDTKTHVDEIGSIITLGDGIVSVYGLSEAVYGEMVIFETGVKGMVQSLEADSVSCVLLGSDYGLHEGSKVKRSGRRAGVPVGDNLIGRVVDATGAPIDGKGEIKTTEFYPVESPAPGVIERKSVSVPLETGIMAIDSMFPIGRGQRELIIGDRQTGKTAIAVDTIVNQKGKDVICIYVAIGQKASTVAKLVNDLEKHGAMDYSVVVSASASDPAPLQYIAPYAGTAMAEYFMHQGKDVLIVYDDLSKHAVAYRAMSLLLERPPGREAYPGDVFYLHSRLLERSSRLDDEHGGGSITALPIIETLAGDISAYIPTNVISITDGQIFLESELFFAGQRPAVNVGLSVSRVGGAAQTKAMKKVAGSLRIDLAQYREMEVFTQFSSDLDPATKELLDHGDRIMELLKQPLLNPLPLHAQVSLLCAAKHKLFMPVPLSDMKEFKNDLVSYLERSAPELMKSIDEEKILSDESENALVEDIKEFVSSRYGNAENEEEESNPTEEKAENQEK
ncbi:MAG TPA: F0F1 ATP synthase subunit alpha [Firmicutes bacterium]|nr:F0F1 ATP synthase subunit alpha [Bacillota bacterium]